MIDIYNARADQRVTGFGCSCPGSRVRGRLAAGTDGVGGYDLIGVRSCDSVRAAFAWIRAATGRVDCGRPYNGLRDRLHGRQGARLRIIRLLESVTVGVSGVARVLAALRMHTRRNKQT
jgi:hypothetical protein